MEGKEEPLRDAIGIDPDSTGFVCALVRVASARAETKGFMATQADLGKFGKWVKALGDISVAIEGSNGLSKPLEKALREAGVVFYSFKPADTDKFRKAVLGQNKDNEKDAEAVARYAMALEAQGKLERYRRVWFADVELQLLTRRYERKSCAKTAEVNGLWKLIRHASPDLYLALGGRHPEVELSENMLQNVGILSLLGEQPNLGEWKNLSEQELLAAMGGTRSGRRELIRELRKVAGTFPAISPAVAFMIRDSARNILRLKREEADICKMLEQITKNSPEVQTLKQKRGIGMVTAASIVAEIVNIRRFVREDNLAGYAGLGRRERSTGDSTREVLPREKFVSVYCDLLQEVQRSRNVGTDPATAGNNVAEVLNRAGVSREEFEETTRWYNVDVQRWKTFYEDVTRELERREVPMPPPR